MKKTLYTITAITNTKYQSTTGTEIPIKIGKWMKFIRNKYGRLGFKYKGGL